MYAKQCVSEERVGKPPGLCIMPSSVSGQPLGKPSALCFMRSSVTGQPLGKPSALCVRSSVSRERLGKPSALCMRSSVSGQRVGKSSGPACKSALFAGPCSGLLDVFPPVGVLCQLCSKLHCAGNSLKSLVAEYVAVGDSVRFLSDGQLVTIFFVKGHLLTFPQGCSVLRSSCSRVESVGVMMTEP